MITVVTMEHAKDIWARLAATPVNPPYVTDGSEKLSRQASMPNNFGKPERKVTSADGLTGKQVYARFLDNMREAVHPDGHPLAGTPRRWTLTRAQKELAQLMWRQELMLKQRAQKKTDAAQEVSVVLEYDE